MAHVPRDGTGDEKVVDRPTSPPESIFKKLQPSKNRYSEFINILVKFLLTVDISASRYTILKDEL